MDFPSSLIKDALNSLSDFDLTNLIKTTHSCINRVKFSSKVELCDLDEDEKIPQKYSYTFGLEDSIKMKRK